MTNPADPGRAFREHLERRVTAHAVRQHEIRRAPPEVIERRIDGERVVFRPRR